MHYTKIKTLRLNATAFLISWAGLPLLLSDASAEPIVTAAKHMFPDGGRSFSNGGAGMATDGIVFDNVLGQTFTAEQTGILYEVSFIATRLNDLTSADLRIDIAEYFSDQPGDVLGTSYIPAQEFETGFLSGNPDTFNKTVSFAREDISLRIGARYALLFSTDVTEANYRVYGDNSGYLGGNWIKSQNGAPFSYSGSTSDLFFRVNLISVPEPSSIAAVTIACFIQLLRPLSRQSS